MRRTNVKNNENIANGGSNMKGKFTKIKNKPKLQ